MKRARSPLGLLPGSSTALAVGVVAAALVGLAVFPGGAEAQRTGEEIYRATCAPCHEPGGIVPATRIEVIRSMSADAIFTVLDRGMMSQQASGLTAAERRAVAEYLSGLGAAGGRGGRGGALAGGATPPPPIPSTMDACAGAPSRVGDLAAGSAWRVWGGSERGVRFQPAEAGGLTAGDVPNLQLRWAFTVPGVTQMRSQPAVAGGQVFLAAVNGQVYALEADTGCVIWNVTVNPPARAGAVVGEIAPGRHALFIPTQSGDVHALDAATGAPLWRVSVSEHPRTALTGTPLFHEGRLYVPVSAIEVFSALDPRYECCTFRGGVVALDAATGATVWRYHTIAEEPTARGVTSAGTPNLGPSGAPVWSSPTLDVERGRLYIGVGENFSHPTTTTSDAIHAIDLETGRLVWSFQATERDAWNMACGGSDAPAGFPRDVLPNCPEENGPDFDFGVAPLIVSVGGGREILVAGQKAGMVFGLDPDRNGEVVWQARVGRGGTLGGVHWGMAAEGSTVLVPVSDRPDGNRYSMAPRSGVVGLDAATGAELWFTPAPRGICAGRTGCFAGYSAPATAIPGAVFAGSLDGYFRAFSTADGRQLWEFDTAREFTGVNGATGRGGSMDVAGPVVAGGMVFVPSGYSTFGQMPGNVLLAFSR